MYVYSLVCSDEHGVTPMHYACMYGHPGIVDYLMNHGARIAPTDMGGNTILHVAVQQNRYDVIIRVSPSLLLPFCRWLLFVVLYISF